MPHTASAFGVNVNNRAQGRQGGGIKGGRVFVCFRVLKIVTLMPFCICARNFYASTRLIVKSFRVNAAQVVCFVSRGL